MNEEDDSNEDQGSGLKRALATIGEVSQLGFTLAIAVILGVGLGYWLDNTFGTGRIFKLIFLFVGLAAGILNAYKRLSRYFDSE